VFPQVNSHVRGIPGFAGVKSRVEAKEEQERKHHLSIIVPAASFRLAQPTTPRQASHDESGPP
jgi:hypothetical protein